MSFLARLLLPSCSTLRTSLQAPFLVALTEGLFQRVPGSLFGTFVSAHLDLSSEFRRQPMVYARRGRGGLGLNNDARLAPEQVSILSLGWTTTDLPSIVVSMVPSNSTAKSQQRKVLFIGGFNLCGTVVLSVAVDGVPLLIMVAYGRLPQITAFSLGLHAQNTWGQTRSLSCTRLPPLRSRCLPMFEGETFGPMLSSGTEEFVHVEP